MLQPGTDLDRYQVEGILGEGGMAMVYKVRHKQLGTLHALKVLTIAAPSVRERLLQEGRVQGHIRHPNIVTVTDVIDVNGAPGLIMEYINGASLDHLLVSRRLTLEQADHLAVGILSGVAAAHALGLIHRDLKPANIMLAITEQGLVPKVTDFGLAKILGGEAQQKHSTRSGAAMGTPAYMAPEQVRDSKSVDERADVYSLGAILYEMVTGQRAFDGEDMLEIFTSIRNADWVRPGELVPELPDHMRQAIESAMESNVDKRVADVRTLLAMWRGEDMPSVKGPWDDEIMDSMASMGGGGMPISNLASVASAPGSAAEVSQPTYDPAMDLSAFDIAKPVDQTTKPMPRKQQKAKSISVSSIDGEATVQLDRKAVSIPPTNQRGGGWLRWAVLGTVSLVVFVVFGFTGSLGLGGVIMALSGAFTPEPDGTPSASTTRLIEVARQVPQVAQPEPVVAAAEADEEEEEAEAEEAAVPTPRPRSKKKAKSKRGKRAKAAPKATTAAPEPEEPAEEEAEAPDAADAVPANKSRILVKGDVDRVYLVPAGGGAPSKPGENLKPGSWSVQLFIDGKPVEAQTVRVLPGEVRKLTCSKAYRTCR